MMTRHLAAAAAIVLSLAMPGRAAVLFGDTVTGSVRRTTDPIATNYFAQPTAVVDNFTEFSGVDGDHEITANFQSTDYVIVTVDRIPTSPNATPPNYRFTFTDLDFTPSSMIVGVSRFPGGTPGVNPYDITFGPDSAAFSVNSIFLSNGGSFGIGVQFNNAVPEPATLAALASLGALATRVRRRAIGERASARG